MPVKNIRRVDPCKREEPKILVTDVDLYKQNVDMVASKFNGECRKWSLPLAMDADAIMKRDSRDLLDNPCIHDFMGGNRTEDYFHNEDIWQVVRYALSVMFRMAGVK